MSRRSNRKQSVNSTRLQRDVRIITSGLSRPLLRRYTLPISSSLAEVEDRRRWRPNPRLIRTVKANVAKVKPLANLKLRSGLILQAPKDAVICVRRKMRRESMFALGMAGGRGSRSRKRFNETSSYRC